MTSLLLLAAALLVGVPHRSAALRLVHGVGPVLDLRPVRLTDRVIAQFRLLAVAVPLGKPRRSAALWSAQLVRSPLDLWSAASTGVVAP